MKSARSLRSLLVDLNILQHHLQYNFYPPHPAFMIAVCRRAILKARKGKWDELVRMPAGIQKGGKSKLRVGDVIEEFRLEDFLT
jgi:hypothetical protein